MKQNNRVAIILHLYHTDLWPEFQSLLLNFSKDIKLYLSLNIKDKNNTNLINQINSNFLTSITYHDNFGADVAPFIQQICEVDEPYFIKIHSKKSTLGNNKQVNWRAIFLYSLLGSKNIFKNNLILIEQPNIGCISNKNLLFGEWENTNSEKIKYLCDILNIDYNYIPNRSFFAGNMFLGHTELYKKYLEPNKISLINLLSQEKKKVNDNNKGTFTHSLERLFGYIVSYDNLEFGFPNFPTIRIKNDLAPDKHFHMITLYNDDCFLQEDINLYGHILDYQPKNFIKIKWLHLLPNKIQNYYYLDENTITKYN